MKRVLLGVVMAALFASSAAARTGGVRDDGYIELCGPSGCARTTDQVAYDQFKSFIPAPGDSLPITFPPAVQPYYTIRAPALHFPAVFAGGATQMAVALKPGQFTWLSLGPSTIAALKKVQRDVRPHPAPLPARVTVNNKPVRVRPVYRHLYDAFPRVENVAPSKQPWTGVAVKWARGTPWPDLAFSVRRGTRLMLRTDYAVRISRALAARIALDTPRKR